MQLRKEHPGAAWGVVSGGGGGYDVHASRRDRVTLDPAKGVAMAGKNRKAEKHRRKRQAKKNEGRIRALRMESRMKSDACVLYACTANRYWRENGEATILVARSVGPGRVTVAAFLVDIWAMGLKDAWGRVDIPVGEFDDMRARLSRDLDSAPLDIGTARHLVFGGIELATELGFRFAPAVREVDGDPGALARWGSAGHEPVSGGRAHSPDLQSTGSRGSVGR